MQDEHIESAKRTVKTHGVDTRPRLDRNTTMDAI